MPVKLENVGIAVRDLDAAIAFFTDLGLTVLGRARISGEWADTAVGLDGNTADIAVLQTPDGNGRIEMFQYVHPDAIEVEPVQPNTIGMHRVSFKVDNIDAALRSPPDTAVIRSAASPPTRTSTSSPTSAAPAASS
jgi:catechol 2,3-dioxygenase-like lactoylglutathione lyase family enzyme